jgi:predicted DNA-binding protein
VPEKPEKLIQTTFVIPKQLQARLKTYASKRGLKLGYVAVAAFEKYLRELEEFAQERERDLPPAA